VYFHLEPNGSEPLYQQLARQLSQRIAGGEWKDGDQLPSARHLSAELGLNFLTVNKVYSILEKEGVLEVRRGLGTFVATRSKKAQKAARIELLDELIDSLVTGARQLRLTRTEVLQRIKEKIPEENL
jgi:GntR family transcriptional regulator